MTQANLLPPPQLAGTDGYVDRIVVQIERLQSRGTDGYSQGIFPSRRTHPYLPYVVEDETIFFTAIVLYTLRAVRESLSAEAQEQVAAMTERCRPTVPRFLNNEGLPIYNYWQVQPEDRFFPNGRILSRFRKFRLPEDIDTTAYAFLAGFHDEVDAGWFQQRLAFHANGSQRWIRHSLPHHRELRAYSTWMGQDNMPVDFDVCAMANALLAVQVNGLPLSDTDEETVRFIRAVVTRGEHMTHPFRIAPWYGSPPIIIYHLARLIARTDIPDLRQLGTRLASDAQTLLESVSPAPMDRILLSTAAMWLGMGPLLTTLPEGLETDVAQYAFFTASLLAVPENRLARALAPLPLFHLRYRCAAHSLALVAEHECLRGS